MDIYVGNLPYSATEEDLTGLFSPYGPVERVKIITDRETGRSKGFGFVTLGDPSQLNAAIEAVNGQEFQGRSLRVNASEPKAPRENSFGGGQPRSFNGERRGGSGGPNKGGNSGANKGGNKGGYAGSNERRNKFEDRGGDDWGGGRRDDKRHKPKGGGGHREKRRGGDDFGDW